MLIILEQTTSDVRGGFRGGCVLQLTAVEFRDADVVRGGGNMHVLL